MDKWFPWSQYSTTIHKNHGQLDGNIDSINYSQSTHRKQVLYLIYNFPPQGPPKLFDFKTPPAHPGTHALNN